MNRHLNIFNFFNGSDADYLEDNLSRGFALCLKYDSVFLDKILQSVLPGILYDKLFDTDYPDYRIEIDLQNRPGELENFNQIIAVACSGREITDFENVIARETDAPETDVCLIINDVCLLFEFKRTREDCAAQLKCQAEKVLANCPETTIIDYVDLPWSKIVKILLNVSSLQKQIHAENPFTNDFIKFLDNFPQWFPSRRLANIPFPVNEQDPNHHHLNARLNQIKNDVYGIENTREYIGKFNRYVIEVDFKWINEVGIEFVRHNERNFINIRMHIGDTKAQGRYFFSKNPSGLDIHEEVSDYLTTVEPYIKFSHFSSAKLWIQPNIEESHLTHTAAFFDEFAGKHQRAEWEWIKSRFDELIFDWKNKCRIPNLKGSISWDDEFENSNRTHFDSSLGTLLTVYIPYEECQRLDDAEFNPALASKFRKLIDEIKRKIEDH